MHWQLAIECSSIGGSVALVCSAEVGQVDQQFQCVLPHSPGSVCSLAPTIERLLGEARLTVQNLRFISVTHGPGSFTGLRVGLATAKVLGWAAGLPIVPVDSLEAIAVRLLSSEPAGRWLRPVRLITAINAFRGQVFSAGWMITYSELLCIAPSCVVDAQAWMADPWNATRQSSSEGLALSASEQAASKAVGQPLEPSALAPLLVSGNALATYGAAALAGDIAVAEDLWRPRAEDVARLGWAGYEAGRALDAAAVMPNYIRSSAAEEKKRQSPPDTPLSKS